MQRVSRLYEDGVLVGEEFVDDGISQAEHAAAYRYERENGGVLVGVVQIKTDQFTRTNLLGARIRAMEDPAYAVNWKTSGGFVALTAAQIIAIADAVAAHVQRCFDAEAAITGGTFNTVDEMRAAFDEAYNNAGGE